MKKLLFALAVLALVIVLCPMQEARAEDICPCCGMQTLSSHEEDDGTTYIAECINCCYYREDKYGDTFREEWCSGGEATCTDRPICETCGKEYGESLAYKDHNWDMETWTTVDEDTHWHPCTNEGCNARKDEAKHSGGAATCTKGPICSKCGNEYGDSLGYDDHDWATTLTNGGDTHYYACSRCDAKKDEAAHSYGSWTKVDDETHEGTCVCGAKTTGEHVWNGSHWCGYPRKCSVCQEYYGETLGHEFWYEYKTEEQHKINCYHCDGFFCRENHSGGTATCTQKAVCEKCGEAYGDYAHDWGEWHVDPEDSTKHIRTCKNGCGASESHAISWGAWEKVDEENHKHTCQGGCGLSETVAHVWNGSHWCGYPRKCRDCGEYYGDTLEHEFWYEYKTEEQHKINCYHCDGLFGRENHSGGTATCMQKAVCEKCGQEYGDYAAHDWDTAWTTGDGKHWHKCKTPGCTEKKDEAEHSGGTATCQAKAKCEKCSEEYGDYADHDWDTAWTTGEGKHWHKCKTPGCTEKKDEAEHSGGTAYCNAKAKCEVCQEEYGEVDLDNHAPGKFHPATCVAAAYCEVEDRIFDEGRKDPNNHDWDMDNWTADGTSHWHACKNGCTAKKDEAEHSGGTASCQAKAKCAACEAEYGDKADHEWDTAWTTGNGKHWHKCLTPGCTAKKDEAEHSGGTATCQAKAKCAVCGEEYGELADHEWDTGWTTGEGKHWHKCKTPGCTAKKDEAEHSGGTATCQAKAKCADCGEEYGEPLGHDLVDHAAQAPTCTAIGWDAYQTCSRCDYTTYEEKAALGHDLVDHAAQAPACTAIGWDAYQTCSRCDYTTYEEKAALGHTEAVDPAVEPTCTNTGLTEGKHCSVCAAVLVEQEVVKAKGHWFARWESDGDGRHSAQCDRCGSKRTVACTMIPLSVTDTGAEAVCGCPICGYCEDGEPLSAVEGARADGTLPDGQLCVFAAVDEDGGYLTVAFERGGKPVQPEGKATLTLPAELLEGYDLALVGQDGEEETPVEYRISGGKVAFTLNFMPEGQPIQAIVLKLIPKG